MATTKHKFQNLFYQDYSKLPFHTGENGLLSLAQGEHSLQINVVDFNGNHSTLSATIIQQPSTPNTKIAKTSVQFSETKIPATIRHIGELIKVDAPVNQMLILEENDSVEIFPVGELFHPSRLRKGKIFLLDSYDLWCAAEIPGILLPTNQSMVLSNRNDDFLIDFPAHTFAHDVWIELIEENNAVRIEPRTVPMKRQAQIRFHKKADVLIREQQIFYWKTKKLMWDMMINCRHSGNWIVANIWSLESFRLGRDSDYPEIIPINFEDGHKYSRKMLTNLQFSVPDKTSDWVQSDLIEMQLDGKTVYPFYNPHQDILKYRLDMLPQGNHTIQLSVTDFANHKTTRTFQITLE